MKDSPRSALSAFSPYTQHVLDHLPDDLAALKQLRRALLRQGAPALVIDLERINDKIEMLESKLPAE